MFLSYRRRDAGEVKRLEQALRLRGVRTWRDVNDVHLGGATEEEILRAIDRETDGFVLYATPELYAPDASFIWAKELPAADRRWRTDGYPVAVLYRDTSPADLSRRCAELGITDFGAEADGAWVPLREDDDASEAGVRHAHAAAARDLLRTGLHRRAPRDGCGVVLRSFPMPDLPPALVDIDWAAAIDGEAPPDWSSELFPALRDLCAELERARALKLDMYPHARLSACLAFGIVFPLASRFQIRLMGRGGEWPQAPGPPPLTPELERIRSRDAARAVIALGFSRDLHEATAALSSTLQAGHVLEVHPSHLLLEKQVRPITEQIGTNLRRLASEGVRDFHLLLAGPAPLAVAVGRQLHALGDLSYYYADEQRQPTLAFRIRV
jgi:CBASS immunity sensor of nucleotide second messenger signals/TIR domain-containing protein